jgi:hypothetical protein
LDNLGVEGRIILKKFKGIVWQAMDWIDLTQVRESVGFL